MVKFGEPPNRRSCVVWCYLLIREPRVSTMAICRTVYLLLCHICWTREPMVSLKISRTVEPWIRSNVMLLSVCVISLSADPRTHGVPKNLANRRTANLVLCDVTSVCSVISLLNQEPKVSLRIWRTAEPRTGSCVMLPLSLSSLCWTKNPRCP